MTDGNDKIAQIIRERAYRIWENRGRPEGQAAEHWRQAEANVRREQRAHVDSLADDEEKLVDGHADVNLPALLTKDVPGG